MITPFCDFLPIFGKKIALFLKNQFYEKIFAETRSSVGKKRQIFGENIFKIITLGPVY
jgi:hypothetical protein